MGRNNEKNSQKKNYVDLYIAVICLPHSFVIRIKVIHIIL